MEQHEGLLRTALSAEERKALRAEARKKGMTVRGYVDQVLRAELERSSNDTGSCRETANYTIG